MTQQVRKPRRHIKKSRPYIKAYFKNYPKKIKLTRRVRRIDAAGRRVLKGAHKKSRPYTKAYFKNYPKKIKLTRRVRRIDAAGCRVLKGAYYTYVTETEATRSVKTACYPG